MAAVGGVLLAAMAILAPVGAWAAPPERTAFSEHLLVIDAQSCPFPIELDLQIWGTDTLFYDRHGDPETLLVKVRADGTNSAMGTTLQEHDVLNIRFDLTTDEVQTAGLPFRVKLPGGGIVIRDAGVVRFDEDRNVVFQGGPHPSLEGDVAAYCAAF